MECSFIPVNVTVGPSEFHGEAHEETAKDFVEPVAVLQGQNNKTHESTCHPSLYMATPPCTHFGLTNDHILQFGIFHPYGIGRLDTALEGHALKVHLSRKTIQTRLD